MAWVRIDDHFDEHPKMQRVGPIAWGFWMAGLAYCNRNLTDGFIPWNKARTLCSFEVQEHDGRIWSLSRSSGMVGDDVTADWIMELLIDAGLWDEIVDESGRCEGYRVHDYQEYQPLKAQIEEERAKKVAAGQAGGQASAQARAQANRVAPAQAKSKQSSTPNPNPYPNPLETNQQGFIVSTASSDAEKENDPPKKAKRRTGTPDAFAPTADQRDWARQLTGMDAGGLAAETERFLDHHRAKGSTMADWPAAWKTWMRNYVEFSKNRRPANGHGNDVVAAVFAEMRANGEIE